MSISILDKYVGAAYRKLDESCPLRTKAYGGLPTSGGFSSNTEYEIGAQRIAEAVHCILGSLGKMFYSDLWTERGHIEEEMGIIEHCVKEYSRDLYVDQLNNPYSAAHQPYVDDTVASIKKKAPKLKLIAQQMKKLVDRSDVTPEVLEVADQCYDFIVVLCDKLLDSVSGDIFTNAFKNSTVISAMRKLSRAVNTLVKLPKETKGTVT